MLFHSLLVDFIFSDEFMKLLSAESRQAKTERVRTTLCSAHWINKRLLRVIRRRDMLPTDQHALQADCLSHTNQKHSYFNYYHLEHQHNHYHDCYHYYAPRKVEVTNVSHLNRCLNNS